MTPHQEDVNEADSKDEQTQIYLYPDLLHVIKGTFKVGKKKRDKWCILEY